jgi:hypothetical protein
MGGKIWIVNGKHITAGSCMNKKCESYGSAIIFTIKESHVNKENRRPLEAEKGK